MCSSELVQLAKVTLVMRQVSGLAIGPDGSVYVAGGLGRDSIVVRYGPGLEELESVTRSMGQVRSIDVAPDGTVYVAGHSYDAPFSGDRYHADIVRYAPDLTTLSTASLHWPGNSSFASVAASIGEFLHVCALAHVEDSGGGRQQVLFIYQCTMLEVLRSSSINSDRVAFQFIAFAPDDTIFVIGYTHREDRSRVAVITNFNARAFEIGFSMVGVDGVDYSFNDLSIAPDGSVYVVGCSEAGGYSSVVRYSSGLEVLGIGLLDGETYNAVVIAPDGSAYVGGSFVGREAGNGCEAIVVRYVP
jgi:WD40 repeat protein